VSTGSDPDADAQAIADALVEATVHVSPEAQSRVPVPAVERLEAKAEALPYPVYIAVIDDEAIGDSGQELVDAVHASVGSDGVYLVTSPHGRLLWTVADDGSGTMEDASQAIVSTQGPGSGYEGVRKASAALDALAEEAGVDTADDGESTGDGSTGGSGAGTTTGQREEPGDTGEFSVDQLAFAILGLGVLVGAIVFAFVGLAANLRAKRLERPPRYRIPGDLLADAAALQREAIQQALSRDTLHIAQCLRDLDTSGVSAERAEGIRRGLDAYTFAGRLVDGEDATRADLAGALVLLTAAGRELEQAEDDTSGRTGTRGRAGSTGRAAAGGLCTVDPTHGEAVRRRRVGADRVRMPVCAVCVEAGRTPDWLRDRGRPYVERDTVWARTRFGASGEDLVDLIRRELVQRQGAD
jgi:hypothetical protein